MLIALGERIGMLPDASPRDLAAAEATLKANIGLLRHCGAEPTATQIAAVAAIENVIITSTTGRVGKASTDLNRQNCLSREPNTTPSASVSKTHFHCAAHG